MSGQRWKVAVDMDGQWAAADGEPMLDVRVWDLSTPRPHFGFASAVVWWSPRHRQGDCNACTSRRCVHVDAVRRHMKQHGGPPFTDSDVETALAKLEASHVG